MSTDRVVETRDTCETEGCNRESYLGESLCAACYRKTIRRGR